MIRYVEDPAVDFEIWDAACEEETEKLPHCEVCGEPTDVYYEIEIGGVICPDCLDEMYRRVV